jgi:S-adenosylmethionine decarboxylase
MKPLGRHLIADIYSCDRGVLNDVGAIRKALLDTTAAVGGTYLTDAFHEFEPHGVSGTVVIAESHLSIHTWPEHGYAAVDIFACGELDPRAGLEVLRLALCAGEIRCHEIRRGLREHPGGRNAIPEDLVVSFHYITPAHGEGTVVQDTASAEGVAAEGAPGSDRVDNHGLTGAVGAQRRPER